MVAHVVEVALSARLRDDESENDVPAVRVPVPRAGLELERGGREERKVVLEVSDPVLRRGRVRLPEEVADPRRHVDEMPDGDLRGRFLVRISGEEFLYRVVVGELSRGRELLDRDARDEFVERAEVESSVLAVRQAELLAREAVRLPEDRCFALCDEHDARERVLRDEPAEMSRELLHELGLREGRVRGVEIRRLGENVPADPREPMGGLLLEDEPHLEPHAGRAVRDDGDPAVASGRDLGRLDRADVAAYPAKRQHAVLDGHAFEGFRGEIRLQEGRDRGLVGGVEGLDVPGRELSRLARGKLDLRGESAGESRQKHRDEREETRRFFHHGSILSRKDVCGLYADGTLELRGKGAGRPPFQAIRPMARTTSSM